MAMFTVADFSLLPRVFFFFSQARAEAPSRSKSAKLDRETQIVWG
jgi:hypothetical protein